MHFFFQNVHSWYLGHASSFGGHFVVLYYIWCHANAVLCKPFFSFLLIRYYWDEKWNNTMQREKKNRHWSVKLLYLRLPCDVWMNKTLIDILHPVPPYEWKWANQAGSPRDWEGQGVELHTTSAIYGFWSHR